MESLPVVTLDSILNDYADWMMATNQSNGQYVLDRLYANESTLIQMLSNAVRVAVPEDPERRAARTSVIDAMTNVLLDVKVLPLTTSEDLVGVDHLLIHGWKGSAMLLVKLDSNEEKQSYTEIAKYLNACHIPSRTHVEHADVSFLLQGFPPVVANVSGLPSAAATPDDKGKSVVTTFPPGGSYFGGSTSGLGDGTFVLSHHLGGMDLSVGGGLDLGGGSSGGGAGGGLDLGGTDLSGGGGLDLGGGSSGGVGGLDLGGMDISGGGGLAELFEFQTDAKEDHEREN